MSQDDQRNQPNEEPVRDVAAGAEAAESARVSASGDTAAGSAPAPAAEAAETTPTTATEVPVVPTAAASHREFHEPGDGAPRYADTPGEAPRSGSEHSWSAEPNPGYQRDPAISYPTKRLVASTLVGALLIAAFVAYGARILTNRSNNGYGSAPWTAAIEKDGAVVSGINAQGNGSPHEIPEQADLSSGNTGTTTSGVFTAAIASCRTASAITVPVTAETGTAAAVGTWSAQATASAQKLRTDAAALRSAINLGHASAVASAANTLCLAYPGVAALPPMPDAEGSKAWSSAVSSFASAATQSLQGVSGNPDATAMALDALNQGEKQLDAVSARIVNAA
jgi:hypothetical protein